jgi:hypothetical protein
MDKSTKKELLSLVCIFFILVFVFATGLHLSYDEDFLLCIVYSLLAFPLLFLFGFMILGLINWIKVKSKKIMAFGLLGVIFLFISPVFLFLVFEEYTWPILVIISWLLIGTLKISNIKIKKIVAIILVMALVACSVIFFVVKTEHEKNMIIGTWELGPIELTFTEDGLLYGYGLLSGYGNNPVNYSIENEYLYIDGETHKHHFSGDDILVIKDINDEVEYILHKK